MDRRLVQIDDTLVIVNEQEEPTNYKVVGLVSGSDQVNYVIACSEAVDFVVCDDVGNILDNEELAQEILSDYLALAEEQTH